MVAEPGAAGRPDAVIRGVDRGGAAPEVGVVVQDPAARAVMLLRGRPARSRRHPRSGRRAARALGEVRDLGRPVVHLGVDVDRVLAVPGGLELLVPDPLQVGRLAPGAAAGDQQVAAELEEEGGQRGSSCLATDLSRRSVVSRAASVVPRSSATRRNRRRWSATWAARRRSNGLPTAAARACRLRADGSAVTSL